jgi:hypothetical protein
MILKVCLLFAGRFAKLGIMTEKLLPIDFHYISWEKMHEMCFDLSEKIRKGDVSQPLVTEAVPLQYIVAISRGGLVVARILSDFLKLPIYNIAIESYEDIGRSKIPRMTQDLGSADIGGKNILLVDEICDTGKTFERAVEYLHGCHNAPASIASACLVLKSKSSFTPDFFCEKIDKWVIFPYEVRETVECLRDKMSQEEIVELGLPKEFVSWMYN